MGAIIRNYECIAARLAMSETYTLDTKEADHIPYTYTVVLSCRAAPIAQDVAGVQSPEPALGLLLAMNMFLRAA